MTSVIARAMEKFPRKGSKDISSNGNANGRVIPPEPVQQQADSNHFVDDNFDPALTAHNLARANKMVKSLKWDQHLAKDAKAYAQKLAKLGKMQHSGVEGQGENLFMSTGDASLEQAVQSWLNEEKKYNGETIGSGNLQDFGHFSKQSSKIL